MSQFPKQLLKESGSLPDLIVSSGEVVVEAMEQFFADAASFSANRFNLYGVHIATFVCWCSANEKTLTALNRADVEEYAAYVKGQYSSDYARHKLECLRKFFDLLIEKGVFLENPAKFERKRRPQRKRESVKEIPRGLFDKSGKLPQFFTDVGPDIPRVLCVFFEEEVTLKAREYVCSVLRLFIGWCTDRSIALQAFDRLSATTFQAYLKSRYRPVTVVHYLSYLWRFFGVLKREGVVVSNPINRLSRSRNGLIQQNAWRIPSLDEPDSIPGIISRTGQDVPRLLCVYIASLQEGEPRRNVSFAIVLFCNWCEKNRIELAQLEAATFVEYTKYLSQKYSASTVWNLVRYISELCDWFVLNKVLPFNPVVRGILPVPKRNPQIVELPTVEQVHALIESIETHTVAGIRDRAIVAMMFYALASPRDLQTMKVNDFFLRDDSWWLRFSGRGGAREVPANSTVVSFLNAYLEADRANKDSDSLLFRTVSWRERPPSRKSQRRSLGLDERIRQRCLKAGLPKLLRPLAIRGAGIRAFLDSGGTIEKAMALTGLTMSGIQTYARSSNGVLVYEGDLDGLLSFLSDSTAEPLQSFVTKSGIFRLTIQTDSNSKEE